MSCLREDELRSGFSDVSTVASYEVTEEELELRRIP